MSIINYSTTPANNNSAPPNGAPEGMAPSAVNNTIREIMADIRSGVVVRVTTKAAMSALDDTKLSAGDRISTDYRATEGDGGGGLFRVTKTSIATEIAADTQGGVYIPFDTDGTGASGGFIREFDDVILPAWFGAKGDGATDDSAALQGAIDMAELNSTNGRAISLPPLNYLIATSLEIGDHGVSILGNNATLSYTGNAGAITFGLVGGTTYPIHIYIKDLSIDITGTGATGMIIRTSHSRYENVFVTLKSGAVTCKGFTLVGDETNGTGTYYNTFYGCSVGSASAGTDHTGVFFSSTTPTYRGPNANVWIGGRVGQCATAFWIAGVGNSFYSPTVECAIGVGTAFKFVADSATSCVQNQIYGGYVENVLLAYEIATNASNTMIQTAMLTGVTTDVTDNSSSTQIMGSNDAFKLHKGIQFTGNVASSDVNTLDFYEEGTWTPTLVGAGTAGTYGLALVGATYTRIGDIVYVKAKMTVTITSAGTGTATIGGLPFTKTTDQTLTGSVSYTNITLPASTISLNVAHISTSVGSTFGLQAMRDGTSPTYIAVTDLTANAVIDVAFFYKT